MAIGVDQIFIHKKYKTDYVLFDNEKSPWVVDKIIKKVYYRELNKIKNDSNFELIFNKDGVMLFKRKIYEQSKKSRL